MNDKFEIKRFLAYAKKHYWDNKVEYGIATFVVFMLTIIIGTDGNFMATYNANTISQASRYVGNNFTGIFIGVGALYTVGFAMRSLSGRKAKFMTINDMSLPVSNMERYIFALLNSTIVPFVIFSIVFCLGASYVESLYSFDITNHNYYFEGIFGAGDPSIKSMDFSSYTHKELFSLYDTIFYTPSLSSPIEIFASRCFVYSIYFYFVAVVMWGTVTFRKYSFVTNFLVHLVVIGLMSSGLVNIINSYLGQRASSINIIEDYSNFKNALCALSPLLFIPSIAYFTVVWYKLKNLSLYK